jgi:broad specificity phosphatase PhoE
MFGFGPKKIDIEFYLGKIKHNLDSSQVLNFKENKYYAKEIYDFIKHYIKHRHSEIHQNKLYYLKKAEDYCKNLIESLDKEDKDLALKSFAYLFAEFSNYAKYGSVYLLRHADKSKEVGRNLSSLGVKQMRDVADFIQEEILLSPKPVKIKIYTSEVKRTHIFSKVIHHINKAEKIGEKEIEISDEKDKRLYMGNLSEGCYKLYGEAIKEYGKEKGAFNTFKDWVNKEKGYAEEIAKGGIFDPDKKREEIADFVGFARKKSYDSNYYTIVIGISHSWMLDVWLYHYTGIDDIISSAEYAKVELKDFYYKGKWSSL